VVSALSLIRMLYCNRLQVFRSVCANVCIVTISLFLLVIWYNSIRCIKDFHTIGTLRFCSVDFMSMMGHWTLQDLSIPLPQVHDSKCRVRCTKDKWLVCVVKFNFTYASRNSLHLEMLLYLKFAMYGVDVYL
jgi:hypothetical protein